MEKKLPILLVWMCIAFTPVVNAQSKGFFEYVVHFETGQTWPNSKEKMRLGKMLDTLKKNSRIKIVYIKGYTDNIGDEQTNIALSSGRSSSIKSFLKKKGISPSLIVVKNYGEDLPVADNETEAG